MTWTNERIEALEALLAAATPGPWHVDGLHTSAVIVRMSEHAWRRVAETDTALFHNPNWRADTTLIALSPALAARVIELEAEVERLRKREKFLRGISPSVAAMLDEYDTPTDAVLATANAD